MELQNFLKYFVKQKICVTHNINASADNYRKRKHIKLEKAPKWQKQLSVVKLVTSEILATPLAV